MQRKCAGWNEFLRYYPDMINTDTSPEILLADDDTVLAELLQEYLQGEQFSVTVVNDGEAALRAASNEYSLIILDIMMPKMDGLDVLKVIRNRDIHTPVIMLTARGDDIDRILGLELGADDYMPKPCNPRELLARIKAIMRRSGHTNGSEQTVETRLSLSGLDMNPQNREARLAEGLLSLTHTEFELLYLLLAESGRLVSKEQISEKILGRKLGAYDRSIDVHISNLRRKLSSSEALSIQTIRGNGYLLAVAE